MRALVVGVSVASALLFADVAAGQNSLPASEIEALKSEIQKLQERLHRLEQSQAPRVIPAAVAPPVTAQAAPPPAPPGEREIRLEREHPLEVVGLPKPELGGFRLSGFVVGSFSYNSRIQMVPEFAGGAQALADAGATNFRFDKFGLGVAKTFAPWLSAGAAIEVESHRDRHSHGFDPQFGCPGTAPCKERFGTEAAETDVTLDKFNVTVIAPLGNGLSLSLGRFDIPFGIERHDEPLNLTATTSEVFQFGRPQRYTGFQVAYQFTPWLDTVAWLANRWESETTHDPFDDNNKGKTVGGRIGFTPFARDALLNFGIGGSYGPERDDKNGDNRWVLDFDVTWTPIRRLLFAAELIYGGEKGVSFRERGTPIAAPEVTNADVNWLGFYLLAHYDVTDWLGITLRYGYFDDIDAARTGVDQVLQSFTVAPIVHLSRLIPDLRPTGATYARTRHPIDWVNLKVEYRLNHSNRAVFSDTKPGTDITDAEKTNHQLQLQLVVNF